MTHLQNLQRRLIARALDHRLQRPSILLDALNLTITAPAADVPPALTDALNQRSLFLPPEHALESMRVIVASKTPQFQIFASLCFHAASSWKQKNLAEAPAPGSAVGSWRLLGAEVQASLLFCALHERVHVPLLRAILHAVPHSLHVLPDDVFVPIFIAMHATCPRLLDEMMHRRAETLLKSKRVAATDLIRLTVTYRPGIGPLRELWAHMAAHGCSPADAQTFLHEGLEQPGVHITPEDNEMLAQIYDTLHRRPDLLKESLYTFVHIYAKSSGASATWAPVKDAHTAKVLKSFLDDLAGRTLQLDLSKLKSTHLSWYVAFAGSHGSLTETDVASLSDLISAHGFRSGLEPHTDANRRAMTLFHLQQIVLAVVAAAQALPAAMEALPKMLCAHAECCAAELRFYRSKIQTGELCPLPGGGCSSLLPQSRQVQREAQRWRRRTSAPADAQKCEIADPQATVVESLTKILEGLRKQRIRTVITKDAAEKLAQLMHTVVPRGREEVANLISIGRLLTNLGASGPLLQLLRLFRFEVARDGEGAARTIRVRHVLYLREEVQRELYLSWDAPPATNQKFAIFVDCRRRVLSKLFCALLPPRVFDPNIREITLTPERAADITKVLEMMLQLTTVVKDAEALTQTTGDVLQLQHTYLRLAHVLFPMLRRLINRVRHHPAAPTMTTEALSAHQPAATLESEIVGRALRPAKGIAHAIVAKMRAEADDAEEAKADAVEESENFEEENDVEEFASAKTAHALSPRVLADRFALAEAARVYAKSDEKWTATFSVLWKTRDALWKILENVRPDVQITEFNDAVRFHCARMTAMRHCIRLWPERFLRAFVDAEDAVGHLSAALAKQIVERAEMQNLEKNESDSGKEKVAKTKTKPKAKRTVKTKSAEAKKKGQK